MTIKSGFFNSLNHDRMYDADDMNAIFDGIITDGVFGNIGNRFIVTPGSGMTINIGTGKARLHQIFVENDANLVLQVSQSDVLLNRIDVVVIRVDKTISGRRGDITILKGTPFQNPIAPTLSTDGQIWEMPIAYINVNANASKIGSSDIQYLVGRNSTPLITAPMQTMTVDPYVRNMENQFKDWFAEMKEKLSQDAAGNLQNQINAIKSEQSQLLQRVYPVGSFYISEATVNPATLFGFGRWEKIEDRFLIGAGRNTPIKSSGGSKTHSHGNKDGRNGNLAAAIGATNNQPNTIGYKAANDTNIGAVGGATYVVAGTSIGFGSWNHFTQVVGQTAEDSTLPPYYAVNIWRRVA
nr:MAG TPA: Receptor Binding Protein [Caudoviricetes sp.]